MVAAGVLAGGVGHQAVEAVAARSRTARSCRGSSKCRAPTRTSTPRALEPRATRTRPFSTSLSPSARWMPLSSALSARRLPASRRASTSQPAAGAAGPGAGQPADATAAPAANATQPVRGVVETAKTVVKEVPEAASATSASRRSPGPAGLTPAGAAAPPVPRRRCCRRRPRCPASADPPGPRRLRPGKASGPDSLGRWESSTENPSSAGRPGRSGRRQQKQKAKKSLKPEDGAVQVRGWSWERLPRPAVRSGSCAAGGATATATARASSPRCRRGSR